MTRASLVAICFCVCVGVCSAAQKQHSTEGMVVSVEMKSKSVVISCEAIPGYMDAMEMAFEVRSPEVLQKLHAGARVRFTMVEDQSRLFAEDIRVVRNVNGEAEPVEAARLTVDPGFGFGKNLEHNLTLLRHLAELAVDGTPLLVGLSRKATVGTLTGRQPAERVYGSVALAVLATLKGARIVRVHDVAATVDALKVTAAVQAQDGE